jgi:cell fate regulator YaaT (PSP1 superfamily)
VEPLPVGPPLWPDEPLDPETVHDVAEGESWDETREVVSVVDVELAPLGPYMPFDAQGMTFVMGERVVVATMRGLEMGVVVRPTRYEMRRGHDLPKVIRRAGPGDERQSNRNIERAQEAKEFADQRVRELGLPMKLLGVEILQGGSRAVFHFESEERIDFRLLVRDLADRLRLRIDMRQVGVRDAAKLIGTLGRCGQPACCARYLRNFCPVSIRMAKDQNLVLSPEKVSGVCGRLLCCLSYEHEGYRALRAGLPKSGKRILTSSGEGMIKDVDVLRRLVTVELHNGDRKVFTADELGLPVASAPPPVPGAVCSGGGAAPVEAADAGEPGGRGDAAGDEARGDAARSTAADWGDDEGGEVEGEGPESGAAPVAAGGQVPQGGPGMPDREGGRRRRSRRRRRHGGGPGGMGGPGGPGSSGGPGGPGPGAAGGSGSPGAGSPGGGGPSGSGGPGSGGPAGPPSAPGSGNG